MSYVGAYLGSYVGAYLGLSSSGADCECFGEAAPIMLVTSTFSVNFSDARLTPWTATLAGFPPGGEVAILVHFTDRNEMYVARDAEGVWRWPFDIEPDNAVDLGADPVTLQLMPRGGWPPCDVEIQVAAAVMAEES